jgi:hypothetical protein
MEVADSSAQACWPSTSVISPEISSGQVDGVAASPVSR